MTNTIAIIQARTGSTRLPGKVMYNLGSQSVLGHVVSRVKGASGIDKVVVATTENHRDDIIDTFCLRRGINLLRGDEEDVLSRFEDAAQRWGPRIIVRITADCPLISPRFLSHAVSRIEDDGFDYVTAGLDRTFPRGTTAEAFTCGSFAEVAKNSRKPHQREHVTPYYRENPDEFTLHNVESEEVFDASHLQDRTDLRLTLDEPADYELLSRAFERGGYEDTPDLSSIVKFIDEEELGSINEHVRQKKVQ